MRIEGDYTFAAPLELVWLILLDPVSVQRALPGCEQLDQDSAAQYQATLRIKAGPFKGLYNGKISLDQVKPYQGFDLAMEGMGPEGPINGTGHLFLEEEAGETKLHYAGDVQALGATSSNSPRLVITTANALIRQYLEAIEQQIQAQTRIYTTEIKPSVRNGRPRNSHAGTANLTEWAARAKRDRRITLLVFVLLLMGSLTIVGGLVTLRAIIRWGFRNVARQVAAEMQENQQKTIPSG